MPAFFPLIAAIMAMIASQIIKLTTMVVSHKRLHWQSLTRPGGMPSSHAALTTAIAMSMGLRHGFDSSFFFIGTVVAFVVIYDARGIRYAVGRHASVINHRLLPAMDPPLNEHVGHTIPQIIVGICIGILVPLGLYQYLHI